MSDERVFIHSISVAPSNWSWLRYRLWRVAERRRLKKRGCVPLSKKQEQRLRENAPDFFVGPVSRGVMFGHFIEPWTDEELEA